MEDSSQWQNLNLMDKISVVSTDIIELLDEMRILTAPGGELDSAIQEASQSFEPLFNVHGLNLEMNENEISSHSESETEAEAVELLEQEKSIIPEPSTSKSRTRQSNINLSKRSQIEHQDTTRSKYRLETPQLTESSIPDLPHQVRKSLRLQTDNVPQVSYAEELSESDENQEMESVSLKDKTTESRKARGTFHSSGTHYSSPRSRENNSDWEELSEGDIEEATLKSDRRSKSASSRKTFGTSVYESFTHYSMSPSKEAEDTERSKRSVPSKSRIF